MEKSSISKKRFGRRILALALALLLALPNTSLLGDLGLGTFTSQAAENDVTVSVQGGGAATVKVGETLTLAATVEDDGGGQTGDATTVTWSETSTAAGNPFLTIPSGAGATKTVTGDKIGSAVVTASNGVGNNGTIDISVVAGDHVLTAVDDQTMTMGDSPKAITIEGSKGTLTAVSGDETIASVAADNGNKKVTITAVAPGTTTITVSSALVENKYPAADDITFDVTVSPKITSVTVSPSTAYVNVGGTVDLSAAVVADPDSDTYKGVTWSRPNGDSSIADVSSAGVVTGKAAGTTTVTATSSTNTEKSGSATVNVFAAPTFSPASGEVGNGTEVTLAASNSESIYWLKSDTALSGSQISAITSQLTGNASTNGTTLAGLNPTWTLSSTKPAITASCYLYAIALGGSSYALSDTQYTVVTGYNPGAASFFDVKFSAADAKLIKAGTSIPSSSTVTNVAVHDTDGSGNVTYRVSYTPAAYAQGATDGEKSTQDTESLTKVYNVLGVGSGKIFESKYPGLVTDIQTWQYDGVTNVTNAESFETYAKTTKVLDATIGTGAEDLVLSAAVTDGTTPSDPMTISGGYASYTAKLKVGTGEASSELPEGLKFVWTGATGATITPKSGNTVNANVDVKLDPTFNSGNAGSNVTFATLKVVDKTDSNIVIKDGVDTADNLQLTVTAPVTGNLSFGIGGDIAAKFASTNATAAGTNATVAYDTDHYTFTIKDAFVSATEATATLQALINLVTYSNQLYTFKANASFSAGGPKLIADGSTTVLSAWNNASPVAFSKLTGIEITASEKSLPTTLTASYEVGGAAVSKNTNGEYVGIPTNPSSSGGAIIVAPGVTAGTGDNKAPINNFYDGTNAKWTITYVDNGGTALTGTDLTAAQTALAMTKVDSSEAEKLTNVDAVYTYTPKAGQTAPSLKLTPGAYNTDCTVVRLKVELKHNATTISSEAKTYVFNIVKDTSNNKSFAARTWTAPAQGSSGTGTTAAIPATGVPLVRIGTGAADSKLKYGTTVDSREAYVEITLDSSQATSGSAKEVTVTTSDKTIVQLDTTAAVDAYGGNKVWATNDGGTTYTNSAKAKSGSAPNEVAGETTLRFKLVAQDLKSVFNKEATITISADGYNDLTFKVNAKMYHTVTLTAGSGGALATGISSSDKTDTIVFPAGSTLWQDIIQDTLMTSANITKYFKASTTGYTVVGFNAGTAMAQDGGSAWTPNAITEGHGFVAADKDVLLNADVSLQAQFGRAVTPAISKIVVVDGTAETTIPAGSKLTLVRYGANGDGTVSTTPVLANTQDKKKIRVYADGALEGDKIALSGSGLTISPADATAVGSGGYVEFTVSATHAQAGSILSGSAVPMTATMSNTSGTLDTASNAFSVGVEQYYFAVVSDTAPTGWDKASTFSANSAVLMGYDETLEDLDNELRSRESKLYTKKTTGTMTDFIGWTATANSALSTGVTVADQVLTTDTYKGYSLRSDITVQPKVTEAPFKVTYVVDPEVAKLRTTGAADSKQFTTAATGDSLGLPSNYEYTSVAYNASGATLTEPGSGLTNAMLSGTGWEWYGTYTKDGKTEEFVFAADSSATKITGDMTINLTLKTKVTLTDTASNAPVDAADHAYGNKISDKITAKTLTQVSDANTGYVYVPYGQTIPVAAAAAETISAGTSTNNKNGIVWRGWMDTRGGSPVDFDASQAIDKSDVSNKTGVNGPLTLKAGWSYPMTLYIDTNVKDAVYTSALRDAPYIWADGSSASSQVAYHYIDGASADASDYDALTALVKNPATDADANTYKPMIYAASTAEGVNAADMTKPVSAVGANITNDKASSYYVVYTKLSGAVVSGISAKNGKDTFNFIYGDEVTYDAVNAAAGTIYNGTAATAYNNAAAALSAVPSYADGSSVPADIVVNWTVPDATEATWLTVNGSTATVLATGGATATTQLALTAAGLNAIQTGAWPETKKVEVLASSNGISSSFYVGYEKYHTVTVSVKEANPGTLVNPGTTLTAKTLTPVGDTRTLKYRGNVTVYSVIKELQDAGANLFTGSGENVFKKLSVKTAADSARNADGNKVNLTVGLDLGNFTTDGKFAGVYLDGPLALEASFGMATAPITFVFDEAITAGTTKIGGDAVILPEELEDVELEIGADIKDLTAALSAVDPALVTSTPVKDLYGANAYTTSGSSQTRIYETVWQPAYFYMYQASSSATPVYTEISAVPVGDGTNNGTATAEGFTIYVSFKTDVVLKKPVDTIAGLNQTAANNMKNKSGVTADFTDDVTISAFYGMTLFESVVNVPVGVYDRTDEYNVTLTDGGANGYQFAGWYIRKDDDQFGHPVYDGTPWDVYNETVTASGLELTQRWFVPVSLNTKVVNVVTKDDMDTEVISNVDTYTNNGEWKTAYKKKAVRTVIGVPEVVGHVTTSQINSSLDMTKEYRLFYNEPIGGLPDWDAYLTKEEVGHTFIFVGYGKIYNEAVTTSADGKTHKIATAANEYKDETRATAPVTLYPIFVDVPQEITISLNVDSENNILDAAGKKLPLALNATGIAAGGKIRINAGSAFSAIETTLESYVSSTDEDFGVSSKWHFAADTTRLVSAAVKNASAGDTIADTDGLLESVAVYPEEIRARFTITVDAGNGSWSSNEISATANVSKFTKSAANSKQVTFTVTAANGIKTADLASLKAGLVMPSKTSNGESFAFHSWKVEKTGGSDYEDGLSDIDVRALTSYTITAMYYQYDLQLTFDAGEGSWIADSVGLTDYTVSGKKASNKATDLITTTRGTTPDATTADLTDAAYLGTGLAVETNLKPAAGYQFSTWMVTTDSRSKKWNKTAGYNNTLQKLVYSLDTMDRTLTAVYETKPATVTFDLGEMSNYTGLLGKVLSDGGGDAATQLSTLWSTYSTQDATTHHNQKADGTIVRNSVLKTTKIPGNLVEGTRIGAWSLKGWYTRSGETEASYKYTKFNFGSDPVSDDMTLYAIWETTVDVVDTGSSSTTGTSAASASGKVEYNTKIDDLSALFGGKLNKGYASGGYEISADGGNTWNPISGEKFNYNHVTTSKVAVRSVYYTTAKLVAPSDVTWSDSKEDTLEAYNGGTASSTTERTIRVRVDDAADLATRISAYQSKLSTTANFAGFFDTATGSGTTVSKVTKADQKLYAVYANANQKVNVYVSVSGLAAGTAFEGVTPDEGVYAMTLVDKSGTLTVANALSKVAEIMKKESGVYELSGYTVTTVDGSVFYAKDKVSSANAKLLGSSPAAVKQGNNYVLQVSVNYEITRLAIQIHAGANNSQLTAKAKAANVVSPAYIYKTFDKNGEVFVKASEVSEALGNMNEISVADPTEPAIKAGLFLDTDNVYVGAAANAATTLVSLDSKGFGASNGYALTQATSHIVAKYDVPNVSIVVKDSNGKIVGDNHTVNAKGEITGYTGAVGHERAKSPVYKNATTVQLENGDYMDVDVTITPAKAARYLTTETAVTPKGGNATVNTNELAEKKLGVKSTANGLRLNATEEMTATTTDRLIVTFTTTYLTTSGVAANALNTNGSTTGTITFSNIYVDKGVDDNFNDDLLASGLGAAPELVLMTNDYGKDIKTLDQLVFQPFSKNGINGMAGFKEGAAGTFEWSTDKASGASLAKSIKLSDYVNTAKSVDVDAVYRKGSDIRNFSLKVSFVTASYSLDLDVDNGEKDYVEFGADADGDFVESTTNYNLNVKYVGPASAITKIDAATNALDALNSTYLKYGKSDNSVKGSIQSAPVGGSGWAITQTQVSKTDLFDVTNTNGVFTVSAKESAYRSGVLKKRTPITLTASYNQGLFKTTVKLTATTSAHALTVNTTAASKGLQVSKQGGQLTDVTDAANFEWNEVAKAGGTGSDLQGFDGAVYSYTDLTSNLGTVVLRGVISGGAAQAATKSGIKLTVKSSNTGVLTVNTKALTTPKFGANISDIAGNTEDKAFEILLSGTGKEGQTVITVTNNDDNKSEFRFVVNALGQKVSPAEYQAVTADGSHTVLKNLSFNKNEKAENRKIRLTLVPQNSDDSIETISSVSLGTGNEAPVTVNDVTQNALMNGALDVELNANVSAMTKNSYSLVLKPVMTSTDYSTDDDKEVANVEPIKLTLKVNSKAPVAKVASKENANLAYWNPYVALQITSDEVISKVEVVQNDAKGSAKGYTQTKGGAALAADKFKLGLVGENSTPAQRMNALNIKTAGEAVNANSKNFYLGVQMYKQDKINQKADPKLLAGKVNLKIYFQNFDDNYAQIVTVTPGYTTVYPVAKALSNVTYKDQKSVTLYPTYGINEAKVWVDLYSDSKKPVAGFSNDRVIAWSTGAKNDASLKTTAEKIYRLGGDSEYEFNSGNTSVDQLMTISIPTDLALSTLDQKKAVTNTLVYYDDNFRGVPIPLNVIYDARSNLNLKSFAKVDPLTLNTNVAGDYATTKVRLADGLAFDLSDLTVTAKKGDPNLSVEFVNAGTDAKILESDTGEATLRAKFTSATALPKKGNYTYVVSGKIRGREITQNVTVKVVDTAVDKGIKLAKSRTSKLDVYNANGSGLYMTADLSVTNGVLSDVQFVNKDLYENFQIDGVNGTGRTFSIRIKNNGAAERTATDVRISKGYDFSVILTVKTLDPNGETTYTVTPANQSVLKNVKLTQPTATVRLYKDVVPGDEKEAKKMAIKKSVINAVDITPNTAITLIPTVTLAGGDLNDWNIDYTGAISQRASGYVADAKNFDVALNNGGGHGTITITPKRILPKGDYRVRFYLYPENCANDYKMDKKGMEFVISVK